jgi:hypothetical protein
MQRLIATQDGQTKMQYYKYVDNSLFVFLSPNIADESPTNYWTTYGTLNTAMPRFQPELLNIIHKYWMTSPDQHRLHVELTEYLEDNAMPGLVNVSDSDSSE